MSTEMTTMANTAWTQDATMTVGGTYVPSTITDVYYYPQPWYGWYPYYPNPAMIMRDPEVDELRREVKKLRKRIKRLERREDS